MVLNLPGGLFGAKGGISGEEIRAATIIIAKDGSGDTDDIQEGINMLPAGGGVVAIKEGVYNITKSITFKQSNTTLIGAGGSSVISSSGNIIMLSIIGKNNSVVQNMKFDGSGAGVINIGIVLTNSIQCIIKDCWITDTGSFGISLGGAGATVTGNFITACVGAGIAMTSINSLITNNKITNCTSDGIQVGSDGNVIIGNGIDANTLHGIRVSNADDNIIMGNFITNNDVDNAATYDGIFLTVSDRNTIMGNRCWDNDRYEINISDNLSDQNLVSGNILLGSDHVGAFNDAGTNTHPNGASGTNNLAVDDLNIIA